MKRLLDEAEPGLQAVTDLLGSAERHEINPFAKRLIQARILRVTAVSQGRLGFRPALLGVAGLLIAASAAAAGYSLIAAGRPAPAAPSVVPARKARPEGRVARPAPEPAVVQEVSPRSEAKLNERRAEKPRPGEDPAQVAQALRALRKQGDPARAQVLLDQYLKANPRGALAEDALALAIEAAAARKDPRAADYARRYLSSYPNGRFRGVAERAISR